MEIYGKEGNHIYTVDSWFEYFSYVAIWIIPFLLMLPYSIDLFKLNRKVVIKRACTFVKRRTKFLFIFFCCLIATHIKVCGQHFTTVKTNAGVEISENGKKVLFYQQQPKSLNGKYERAGYVHPLYDLNEKVLTEDFPEDHPYHRGIFLAWHQIILNNKKFADGWMSENISWEPIKLKIKERRICNASIRNVMEVGIAK